ncbi:hypothetical protein FNV43_RR14559 [Rhamnella rubrinervis]|uniref:Uncharacterized protein n=1 Tax=Rhamnella rubrinervis TaxID=2594499 RepID=A0A8K0H361_9ROSA|nr:hypothetical protein FNV43_RR14559 [Rhamnella rubrinervis]
MAQQQLVMKTLEVCKVAPPPQPPHSASQPKVLPLTFFDILWLRFPPVERLFFYQISSINTQLFLHSILPKLKHSLSLTLRHFVFVAGNLIWPDDSHKPIIHYADGDGVSLTVTESNMDFYHLSSNDFRKADECRSLIPHLAVCYEQAAVLALQITLFPNSGFCIGVTSHHAVLDCRSSTSFMKLWGQICKDDGADSSSFNPSYDRTLIEDPAELESIFVNEWLKEGSPNMNNNRSLIFREFQVPPGSVRATFQLIKEDIEKLRQSVCAKNSKSPSTFSLVCGYVWVCLEKARIDINKERAIFGFSVDSRSRLKPTLPCTYFGNCIGGCMVVAKREELLGENGVSFAVETISEGIRGLDDGVLKGAETWVSVINSVQSERITSVAGSPRFEVYSTDFGWGRPWKVEISSIDRTGAISLSESKNGNGGFEIGLVLKLQEMKSFACSFAKGLEAL